ncbi:hypothetical protein [Streptomyces sp. NRRL F-5630]|uniref:hypothetical protein n=1 Tax=Streptomyces sp. NRRL F-5630 TaxID=1463864 RepID=UPI0004CA6365|nr:hypothetical protein [Streptomyces sp. NRRL F-5630]
MNAEKVTITCLYNIDDRARVLVLGAEVAFEIESRDAVVSVVATPDTAREFAQGILRLADEAEPAGDKEAPAPTLLPKVGDRLRVTRDQPLSCPVTAGTIVTVVETDYEEPSGELYVRAYLRDGDSFAWFLPLDAVEPADEPPTPSDTPRTRADYAREAGLILGPGAPGILELAQWLAEERATLHAPHR